ncbi:MAG TPA: CBS domain-containing protein [Candidatus Binataceae bacterium]|nr:CBS domain-containing protein [Candidatus Binataceae bacterium]
MKIEGLMKSPVHTVKPQDSVAHARAILEEYRINQLPVVQNRHLVGIVTDRDLRDAPEAVEVAASEAAHASRTQAPNPERIPIEAVMTANVLTLTPGDDVEDAARLMRRERIGAIPIVERDALVGILTRSDILDAFVLVREQQGSRRGMR